MVLVQCTTMQSTTIQYEELNSPCLYVCDMENTNLKQETGQRESSVFGTVNYVYLYNKLSILLIILEEMHLFR
jgi:hypothetical protein